MGTVQKPYKQCCKLSFKMSSERRRDKLVCKNNTVYCHAQFPVAFVIQASTLHYLDIFHNLTNVWGESILFPRDCKHHLTSSKSYFPQSHKC